MDKQNAKLVRNFTWRISEYLMQPTDSHALIYSFQCTVPHTHKKKDKEMADKRHFSRLE